MLLQVPHVTMSASEYVAVNTRLWRKRPRTWLNDGLLAMAVVVLGSSLVLNWLNPYPRPTDRGTVLLLVVALGYALGRKALVRWQLRRGYVANVGLQAPIDFFFTSDELRGHSTLGKFSSVWATVRRAVQVGDWLLLYPTQSACYYVDTRLLAAPATPADLWQLLETHHIPLQRLKL